MNDVTHSNLILPPLHQGDAIKTHWLLGKLRAFRHPITAARYILRRVWWKVTNTYHLAPHLEDVGIHVIDVGAAGGIQSRWRRLGANLRIALFEPEQVSYQILVAGYSADKRIQLYDCALSEHGKPIDLYLTRWLRASSIFPPSTAYTSVNHIRDHYVVDNVAVIPSKRLQDVYNQPDLDFIKIDTEGYELPILKGAGNLIDKVIGLELEVYFQQVRVGQPLFADVDTFCRANDFTFMRFTNIGNSENNQHFLLPSARLESKGFTCATDAIYFRLPQDIVSLVKSGRWDKQKLGKAVALYLAYDQHEYAHLLLAGAKDASLLEEDDPGYQAAVQLIERCSGYNRSLPYFALARLFQRYVA